MPIGTLRAVQKSGLIERSEYRPSKATRIKYLMGLMDRKSQNTALSIAKGKSEPGAALEADMPEEARVRILDLAAEHIQHRYSKEEIPKGEYSEIFLKTLRARSELGTPREAASDIPVPVEPTQGHKSNKVCVAYGVTDLDEEHLSLEFRYRPTYHDLLDPDEGYIEGAQIEFMDTVLRYYPHPVRFQIQSLELLNILSIAPRDAFFKPISWKVNTGLTRETTPRGSLQPWHRLLPGHPEKHRQNLETPFLRPAGVLRVCRALPEGRIRVRSEIQTQRERCDQRGIPGKEDSGRFGDRAETRRKPLLLRDRAPFHVISAVLCEAIGAKSTTITK